MNAIYDYFNIKGDTIIMVYYPCVNEVDVLPYRVGDRDTFTIDGEIFILEILGLERINKLFGDLKGDYVAMKVRCVR